MSELSDCKQSAHSASRKRRLSADRDESGASSSKASKVGDTSSTTPSTSQSHKSGKNEDKETAGKDKKTPSEGEAAAGETDHASGSNVTNSSAAATINNNNSGKADGPESAQISSPKGSEDAKVDTDKDAGSECHPSTSMDQSDSAAIAAAEALASLTGGDGEDSQETPCSSERATQRSKTKHGCDSSKSSSKTEAAPADSSTSVCSMDREHAESMVGVDEGDDSTPGSSSTPSSSFPSDNEDNDDGECAIVSVKMAPEIRQSVALLAQVQMRLEALEKKNARLHQRLEMKMSHQRRPHLDQRSSITQSIPGFWVTALLNHPHLSAHIDETDEDALSYMIDLEIEPFKNNKLGFRIGFHFRRNPYFQNNVIMKELHLAIGGSPVSFSNPIVWHRGQNLTAHSEPRRTARGVYKTFFSWFSDHSNPSRDDIAQILKDDLYRDPLRYYLTPLWEPRENGSSASGARASDNGNGDECVVISDSDEDQENDEAAQGHSREEDDNDDEDDEEDDDDEDNDGQQRGQSADESPEEENDAEIVIDGSDDSIQDAGEDEDDSFFREKDEELDVEELDESSTGPKVGDQDDDEEDVEIDEESKN